MKKVMDHGAYQKRVRRMTDAQLHFTVKDAREALDAMPDGPNAGFYKDEMLYAAAELNRRDRAFYAKAIRIVKAQKRVAEKLVAAVSAAIVIFAMAAPAEAQGKPTGANLPQYLPPSYSSPHGGTGIADIPKVYPGPAINLPDAPAGLRSIDRAQPPRASGVPEESDRIMCEEVGPAYERLPGETVEQQNERIMKAAKRYFEAQKREHDAMMKRYSNPNR